MLRKQDAQRCAWLQGKLVGSDDGTERQLESNLIDQLTG